LVNLVKGKSKNHDRQRVYVSDRTIPYSFHFAS
jgi:hypothetical protein